MADPFIGEIRVFSFNFPPKGWALCNGQLLPINQNQALFSILSTTYGGDGVTTFALPNLQGRAPVHTGPGVPYGQVAGEESHTLTQAETPAHTHSAQASLAPAGQNSPAGAILAQANYPLYTGDGINLVPLDAATLTSTGAAQPHTNLQPYCAVNFGIALQGIYPSRS